LQKSKKLILLVVVEVIVVVEVVVVVIVDVEVDVEVDVAASVEVVFGILYLFLTCLHSFYVVLQAYDYNKIVHHSQ